MSLSLQLSTQDKKPKAKAACKKGADVDHDREPAKAACEKRAGDDHEPKAPVQTATQSRKRKINDVDLPAKHAEDDEKKRARMEASQTKADDMVKVIRQSGITDLQPPLGFTSKYRDCKFGCRLSYCNCTCTVLLGDRVE